MNENIIKRYKLIPRTLIFINKGNKYLLIHKKKRESYGYDRLNGVGGHIEKGEEPYESARREIIEETGLSIEVLELTAILFIDVNSNPGIQVFTFKATVCDNSVRNSREGNLFWMTKDEILLNSQVLSDVPDLINVCDNHKSGEPPKILKYSYTESGELRIV